MRVLLGAIQVASWGQIHWTSQAGKKASDTPTLGELQFSLGITAPPSEPMASVTCCISSGKSGVYETNHLVCMGQRSAAPLPERMVYLCAFIGVTVTVTPVHLRAEGQITDWNHTQLPVCGDNGKVGRDLAGEARDLTKRNLWLAVTSAFFQGL